MTVVAITKLGITSGKTDATDKTRRNGIFDLTVSNATGTATLTEIIVTKPISKNVLANTSTVLALKIITVHSEPELTDRTNRYTTGINAAIVTTEANIKRNAGGGLPSLENQPDDITP